MDPENNPNFEWKRVETSRPGGFRAPALFRRGLADPGSVVSGFMLLHGLVYALPLLLLSWIKTLVSSDVSSDFFLFILVLVLGAPPRPLLFFF